MMISKALSLLLILILTLSSCAFEAPTETSAVDNPAAVEPEALGYDFVIVDSDGDGVKDDIAELTCLGMSGGYGSFRLEVFVSGENSYLKVFDSEQYALEEETYKKFSQNVDGELMIDTFYSVEAVDVDNDGCEELIGRQYAWVECHAEHVGDVVSTLKIMDNGIEIICVELELSQ